jgi:hypothetical protein
MYKKFLFIRKKLIFKINFFILYTKEKHLYLKFAFSIKNYTVLQNKTIVYSINNIDLLKN